LAKR
jgi:hypothetical protein